jgi:hypothetical protein
MQETSAPEIYKCKTCGLESPIKEAFIQEKGLMRSRPVCQCFECSVKGQWKSLLQTMAMLLGFGLFMVLLRPQGFMGQLYLKMLAALALVAPPLIVLHELAHSAAAWLVGMRVFQIHIGAGKVLFTTRFLGIRWYLRQFPVSGATIISGPEATGQRWRRALVLLAGPGLHLILAVLALLLMVQARPFFTYQFLQILLWTNVFLLLTNLYPRKVAVATGAAGTDGWALVTLLKTPEKEIHNRRSAYCLYETVDAVDRGDLVGARRAAEEGLRRDPDDTVMLNTMGYVLVHLKQYALARDLFLRVQQTQDGKEEMFRNMGLNNVAFCDFMINDAGLKAEADAFSAEAHKNLPWEATIIGTRGTVLLWTGQYDEGIRLLQTAMVKAPERKNKALDACFIAWGEHMRGHPDESQKYLALARKLDPSSPGLERVLPEMKVPVV